MLDDYGYPYAPDARQKARRVFIRSSRGALGKVSYVVLSIVGAILRVSRLGKKYPPLRPATFHPKRILVIRLDLIGDLVLSLTVVRALKRTYPNADIDLLATPGSAPLARYDPHLSEIITYDPNVWRRPKALLQLTNWRVALGLLRRLRARRYDLAVSVYMNWAAIQAALSGAKRRVGYGREGYPGFMTDSLPGGIPGRWRHWSPLDSRHEVDYCLALAQAAGATITAEDRIPQLYVDEQTRREVDARLNALLAEQGAELDRPLIVCHINSNNGQSKRWPIPYWAMLIDKLVGKMGANVVLTGVDADVPLIERVLQQAQQRAINLAGQTSLPQLVALLMRADLLISGDSGPLHMAVGCGVPIIGIYGPTNPILGGPASADATVLRSGIWCSPCYNARDSAECPFFTTQCMKNILPAQVYNVACTKLKKCAGI